MFSRKLLTVIKRHEYSLFGGTVAQEKDCYDPGAQAHVTHRKPGRPLVPKIQGNGLPKNIKPKSYTIRVMADGTIEKIDIPLD